MALVCQCLDAVDRVPLAGIVFMQEAFYALH